MLICICELQLTMQGQHARSNGEGEDRDEVEEETSDDLQRHQRHAHQAYPRVERDAANGINERDRNSVTM